MVDSTAKIPIIPILIIHKKAPEAAPHHHLIIQRKKNKELYSNQGYNQELHEDDYSKRIERSFKEPWLWNCRRYSRYHDDHYWCDSSSLNFPVRRLHCLLQSETSIRG